MSRTPTNTPLKSPIAAALLNFFLPGIGYVYNGIGRDIGELVFGTLIFVFYFIGFEIGVVGFGLTSTASSSATSTGPVSPYAFLIFLVFLLPFAFGYDGYRRAKHS
jgi:hypothetical protein